MLNKKRILERLKTVLDPELQVNIVDLGLIYDVKIQKKDLAIVTMTLTSPGCPLSFVFKDLIRDCLVGFGGIKDVETILTFDPPWNPQKMSDDVKLKLGWFL